MKKKNKTRNFIVIALILVLLIFAFFYFRHKVKYQGLGAGKKSNLKGFFNLNEVSDAKSLRKQYYKLAKEYHPDKGGSKEQMQALNLEYERLLNKINNNQELTEDEKEVENSINEVFKDIINQIIQYDNIQIEIIGTWIWVSGNTYAIKEILKECDFKFAPAKKMWFWHTGEYSKRRSSEMDIEEIRIKYGSDIVKNKERKAQFLHGNSLFENIRVLQTLLYNRD